MLPELATLLREHRKTAFAHGAARPDAFVFSSATGAPLNQSNIRSRVLERAANAAGLNRPGQDRLTFHDLRRTYASHIIRAGLDPVRAATQIGHEDPAVTLREYARDFAAVNARNEVRAKLTAAFRGLV